MRRVFILLMAIGLFACSRHDRIVVASKNFTEQVILGELLAQQIERQTGIDVDRRLNLGGTLICHQAIVSGQIDAYVEYTGTALTAILKQAPINDAARVYENVRRAYHDQFNVEWTEPLGFNNTFVMLVRDDEAKKLNIKTISDAATHSPKWTAGFGYEFIERRERSDPDACQPLHQESGVDLHQKRPGFRRPPAPRGRPLPEGTGSGSRAS